MNFEIAPKETEIRANWYEARMYCFSLDIDGKVGWRLPTRDELNEMYKIYQADSVFKNNAGYWSSTENDSGGVYVQYFYDGYEYTAIKEGHGSVRPVRSI